MGHASSAGSSAAAVTRGSTQRIEVTHNPLMLNLLAASVYFLAIHFGVSGTRLRDVLVAHLKPGAYRGAFALASLLGLAWMIYAFRRAPQVPLWGPLLQWRPVADGLVFIAFLAAVIGLATPSPTRVGMEARLGQGPDLAHGIVRITRHPFLWGVALWALAHLVVNGDLAGLILFGSLLVLALGGTASIDAKRRHAFGGEWAQFAAATSNVPFAAIAAGRNRLRPALLEIGAWRPLAAIAAYAAAFYLHGRLGPPLG